MEWRCSSLLTFSHAAVLCFVLAGTAHATELYDAVRVRDVDKVVHLLKGGADPNKRVPYDGPLHLAARLGPPEMVTLLLDSGANIELAGYSGVRPLHAATLAGQDAIVAILLARGAKVDSLDNVDRTPLLSLVSGSVNNLAILKILLESGADPNRMDGPARFHALDYAAIQGRADVAEILLAFGADTDASDSVRRRAPLHYAIASCAWAPRTHLDVVELLIAHGADVNVRDGEGLTPLDLATRHAPNNGMLHHMLLQAGAK